MNKGVHAFLKGINLKVNRVWTHLLQCCNSAHLLQHDGYLLLCYGQDFHSPRHSKASSQHCRVFNKLNCRLGVCFFSPTLSFISLSINKSLVWIAKGLFWFCLSTKQLFRRTVICPDTFLANITYCFWYFFQLNLCPSNSLWLFCFQSTRVFKKYWNLSCIYQNRNEQWMKH